MVGLHQLTGNCVFLFSTQSTASVWQISSAVRATTAWTWSLSVTVTKTARMHPMRLDVQQDFPTDVTVLLTGSSATTRFVSLCMHSLLWFSKRELALPQKLISVYNPYYNWAIVIIRWLIFPQFLLLILTILVLVFISFFIPRTFNFYFLVIFSICIAVVVNKNFDIFGGFCFHSC